MGLIITPHQNRRGGWNNYPAPLLLDYVLIVGYSELAMAANMLRAQRGLSLVRLSRFSPVHVRPSLARHIPGVLPWTSRSPSMRR